MVEQKEVGAAGGRAPSELSGPKGISPLFKEKSVEAMERKKDPLVTCPQRCNVQKSPFYMRGRRAPPRELRVGSGASVPGLTSHLLVTETPGRQWGGRWPRLRAPDLASLWGGSSRPHSWDWHCSPYRECSVGKASEAQGPAGQGETVT